MTSPYQQRTESNAAQTATRAGAIVAAYRAGSIQHPDLPTYLGPIIRAGAARAVSLADAALAAQLGQLIERPGQVPTLGLTLPADTSAAIDEGVATIVDGAPAVDPQPSEPQPGADASVEDPADELATRVDRLATAAPLDAGQTAHQDAMTGQGVEGWTRETDAKPCPLCKSLADGNVIPTSKRMVRHPGCSCVAVPVLTGADPRQRPEDGPLDPRAFVPITMRTGSGAFAKTITRARPGLVITHDLTRGVAR